MGYEVNSPRIVEAIYYECVPVIIADNFALPFSEVLNWTAFSVVVSEKDIPKIKDILSNIPLRPYFHSDWAGDPLDRTSTTGYVCYLGSSPITWSSKKQRFVSRSSTETEYRAIAATVSETNWLTSLLHELRFRISDIPQIFCDNVSTTFVTMLAPPKFVPM
ncbi:hypothetical protein FXO37_08849 [Capsicum annuum]|nr:hypothetical protein FXO37_08849 [Capsicum annuum]